MSNLENIKFKDGKRHQAGMSVPEGFFAGFEQKMMAEIASSPVAAPQIRIGRQKSPSIGRWQIFSAAACVVLLIGLGVLLYQLSLAPEVLTAESQPVLAQQSQPAESQSEQLPDESDYVEEMTLASMSDFDLYDYYCDSF